MASTLEPQDPINIVQPFTIGDSGSVRYGGYFQDEPQAEWRDEKRIDNVETMRRSDATCKQLLNAFKAPLLATEWVIEAASDDPVHVQHKEFVEKDLFNMRRTWKEFLRESLTYFDFGFSVGELIWEIRQDGIHLVDVEPRIQASIQKWKLTNGQRGVVQQILTDEFNTTKAEIPLNKIFVLTNDKEGDDLTGTSVLRSAWKHFYIKDKLYRISAISCERYGVGIPKITLPEGAGESETVAAKEMGQEMRSNERGVIVLPNDKWKVEILSPTGNPQQGQIDQLIQHHDRMILMAGLAGFLNLGANSTGSYALSQDQNSFFLKHVEDKACYIAEQIIKQIIERIIIVNFGVQESYPKLKFLPLGDVDYSEYSGVLATLVNSGLLTTDGDMMQFTRKMFKLPEMTMETMMENENKNMNKEINDIENDIDNE